MSIAEDKLTLQNLRIGSEDNMDAENQTFQNKSKTLNSIELNSSSTLSHRSLPISSWPWCKYQECFPVNAPCTHWMSLVLGISQNYRIYHLAQVEQFSLLHANFQLPKPDQKKKSANTMGHQIRPLLPENRYLYMLPQCSARKRAICASL